MGIKSTGTERSEVVTATYKTYSRAEMQNEAQQYMREAFGGPLSPQEKAAWFERLGLLTDFVQSRFPE